jgi:hypothetical protein
VTVVETVATPVRRTIIEWTALVQCINQSRSKFIFTLHIAETVFGRTNKSSRDSFASCAWQRSPCA